MSGRLDVELMMGPMKIIVVRVCGGGWGIFGGGGVEEEVKLHVWKY
jgi:hypothetical protein